MNILINDNRLPEIPWLSAASLSIICSVYGIIPTNKSVFNYHARAVFPVESIVNTSRNKHRYDLCQQTALCYWCNNNHAKFVSQFLKLPADNPTEMFTGKNNNSVMCLKQRLEKEKEQHVYTANQYSVYLMSEKCFGEFSKREPLFIGDTSQVTFHIWEMEVWISTDWIIILICRGTYTGMTGIRGLLGRVQLNECGSIHTVGGVQR